MTEPGEPGIDIVIPNWNGKHLLAACLSSLQRQSVLDFQVNIVDNGSDDGSAEFVKEFFPEVNLFEFSANRGFSAAVNKGIASSSRSLVLLLNNDTELDEQCIEILLETSIKEPGYDMFALKMLAFHQRTLLDGAGDSVMRGGVGYRLGTLENDSPEYNLKKEVFGACAGAALYRRTLFSRLGLFDEDFFAYLEDVDFNMRAVRSGCRCLYLPEAVVYHIGSASSGSKINKFTVKLSTRNNIFVMTKNYSVGTFLRFLPAVVIYQFFWLVFVIKKKQFPAYVAGLLSGLKDLGKILQKRGEQKRTPLLTEDEFRKRIIQSEREAIASIMRRRKQQGKTNGIFQFYLRLLC